MFISEKQLEKAEKEINNKIEDLKQKVHVNQGKIILTSREIILRYEPHCFGCDSDSMNYVNTGIINGELKLGKEVNFESIKSVGLMDSNHLIGDYSFMPEVQIPVKNKLRRTFPYFSLDFMIEELEKFKEQGIVGIGRLEFDLGLQRGMRSTPGINMPYANNLEILIGEQEIQNFAKDKIHKDKIDNFFNLIKNPREIENRIDQYYYDKRKNLAEELVQNTAQLSIFNNKIKKLEESVLKAKFIHYFSGEGEWDTLSRDRVYEYRNLRKNSSRFFVGIKENFDEADKTQLIKLPEIDIRILGIPQTVKTKDFLYY